MTLVELRRELEGGEPPPDAPAEIADAVSALRLTTAAAVAAGPVLFETLDGRPFGIQPVLPIAATQPPGESSRLDSFRTPIAVDVLTALGDADGDPELSDALDRWELSLFQNEPFRGEQLRAALASLLGDTWAMRGCVLLGEDPRAREELYGELTSLAAGSLRRRRPWTLRDARSLRCCARATAIVSCTTWIASCSGSIGARLRTLWPSRSNSSFRREAVTPVQTGQGYLRNVDESKAILDRLERIEMLDRAGAAPAELVDELRALLVEAEAWSRAEGGDAGARAVEDLRGALERDMIAM